MNISTLTIGNEVKLKYLIPGDQVIGVKSKIRYTVGEKLNGNVFLEDHNGMNSGHYDNDKTVIVISLVEDYLVEDE